MSCPRHALDCFFEPSGVAVIGATESAAKAGGRRWKTLTEGGFKGAIYPIHPTAKQVRGVTAFTSITDVPGPVDLAVVIVPPAAALDVTRQCAASGVRAIAMIGAGFAEAGPEGEIFQQQLLAIIQDAGMRMVGPNCAGVFSGSCNLNTIGWDVPSGSVGLVSQSGNVALDLSNLAKSTGGGFSRYVTIGNAADVRSVQLLDYLLQDKATQSILLYMEGWGDGEGRVFCDRLCAGVLDKPVIVIRAGRTESGRKAALSHTKSLSGKSRILEAALLQAGVVFADAVEEAWELARWLPSLRPLRGVNIAVLSDGGGHAILLADALELAGLDVPLLSAEVQTSLRQILPARCSVANPIDFAGLSEGKPDVIEQTLKIVLDSPGIDGAILAGHFGGYCDLAGDAVTPMEKQSAVHIAGLVAQSRKPVVVHTIHAGRHTPALDELHAAGVAVCRSIPMAARMMAASRRLPGGDSAVGSVPVVTAPLDHRNEPVVAGTGGWLLESEGRDLLASLGLAVPKYQVAATADECVDVLNSFGVPVAIKLLAKGVVHKSDIGGVALNISDPAEAREAFVRLSGVALPDPDVDRRVLVTPMIAGGVEAIVGAFLDPQFGPVVMFGLGGVWVEALDDVAFRLAPLSLDEARHMLNGIKLARLLHGYRGNPAIDRDAAARLLHQVSLIIAREDVEEIELNPVMLLHDGVQIADVRIRTRCGR